MAQLQVGQAYQDVTDRVGTQLLAPALVTQLELIRMTVLVWMKRIGPRLRSRKVWEYFVSQPGLFCRNPGVKMKN